MLEGEGYEEFRADIACNGQIEPIWTHQGKIIDGRNRYRACMDLGITPHFKEWSGNGSLVAFVVSLNVMRRNLTSQQRAVISLDILPILEAEAKARQVTSTGGNSPQLTEKVPEAEKGEAREQAASLFNTNPHYVSDAKKLKEKAPELLEQVRSGELSLKQAAGQVKSKERTARVEEYPPEFVGDGGYDDLMFAIVKQAITDAGSAKGDNEPSDWLRSDDCTLYFQALGLPFAIVGDWLNTGCLVKRTDEMIIDALENMYKRKAGRSEKWELR